MYLFHNDYNETCLPEIMTAMAATAGHQNPGYGMDPHCEAAAGKIRALCGNDRLAVHFLVGGTQTNLIVCAAALRPHEAVVCAESGHVFVHETGAIEATGHKVVSLPSRDGKITARQIDAFAATQRADENAEHNVHGKLVYISNPTELGTTYSLQELEDISRVCKENGMYLYMDGARLGYALAACDCDVTMADIARLCDVFYIGGTKMGAMFGEAVVIRNAALNRDFRYFIKQRGGLLAKGRLLGIQFDALFEEGLYGEIARHAVYQARRIREAFRKKEIPFYLESPTNQQFPILSEAQMAALSGKYSFAPTAPTSSRWAYISMFCSQSCVMIWVSLFSSTM